MCDDGADDAPVGCPPECRMRRPEFAALHLLGERSFAPNQPRRDAAFGNAVPEERQDKGVGGHGVGMISRIIRLNEAFHSAAAGAVELGDGREVVADHRLKILLFEGSK